MQSEVRPKANPLFLAEVLIPAFVGLIFIGWGAFAIYQSEGWGAVAPVLVGAFCIAFVILERPAFAAASPDGAIVFSHAFGMRTITTREIVRVVMVTSWTREVPIRVLVVYGRDGGARRSWVTLIKPGSTVMSLLAGAGRAD